MIGRLPLRYSIPAALLLLGSLLTGISYYHALRTAETSIEEVMLRRTAAIGHIVAAHLEDAYARGDLEAASREVAGMVVVPQLDVGLMVDESGRVTFATASESRGQAASSAAPGSGLLVKQARSSMLAQYELSADRQTLRAALPVRLAALPGEIRPSRIGVLYIESSLLEQKDPMYRAILQRTGLMAGAALLLCVLVWWYLDRTVTRRVSGLLESTREIGAGHLSPVIRVAGHDELGRVEAGLRRMAGELNERDRALRQSEQRFRLLVEGVQDYAILMLDTEGRVTTWNEGARRITGYEVDEILGEPIDRFYPPDAVMAGLLREQLGCARARGRAAWEAWHARWDGSRFWGSVVMTALHDETGALVGFGTVMRDLTAQREAEEQREHLEAQLRQSQKMQAIGTLAGGIAHDFNNILAAISGYAALALENHGAGHPLHEPLMKIDRAAARGIALVRRLLAFGRPEEPQRSVTDLGALAEEVVGLLRATLPAMIAIRAGSSPDVPITRVDSGQIHQVLMNLATNAAHAIGDRPGRIDMVLSRVTVEAAPAVSPEGLAPGVYACISVSDTGCGMDPATLERIFDPFFTTKSRERGTGLGLSVVHGIMRSHDGAITVQSEPGAGTIFRLFFPSAEESSPAVSAGHAAVRPGCSEHVLCVDDEEALVELTSRALTRLGYRVSAFTDPERALEALRSSPDSFDAVLTDLAMPGMSGLDLARAVRALRPDMPIVIASGYLRQEDAEAGAGLGIRDFVLKPDLLTEIGRILRVRLACAREKPREEQKQRGV